MDREHLSEQANAMKKSPWAFFVNNWQVTLLLIVALIIGGTLSLATIPKESDPEVVIPIAAVTIPYPGASAADVEKLVVDRMEERLQNLENVESLTSTSREGMGSITVEFEASADLDDSIRKLRTEVESAKILLPDSAEDPVVTEIRIQDTPIVTFSILGNIPPEDLKEYGEELQSRLKEIPNVSDVSLFGIEAKEIQVLVDIRALEARNLSIGQVISAIRANHIDMPIGSLLADDFYYQATLKGQLQTAEDVSALPIATVEGQNILLRDIATVREAFQEQRTESTIWRVESSESKRAVTLQLFKRAGGNILDVVDTAKEKAVAYENELPESIDIITTNDFSQFIREDFSTLGRSGLQTIVIIFIIFLIALGAREAFLTAISIPLIFLLGFLGLSIYGETLNSLVLFSLILSLGLIVDTSIVIMEGVHDYMKKHGFPAKEAALLSIKTYRAPLIAGTLTTVSAFIPMALMTGIVGQFVKHIPITVTITLIASLFVALLILPALAVRVFRNFDPTKKEREPLFGRIINPLRAKLERLLERTLASRKRRWAWIGGSIAAFIVAMALPVMGVLKAELFPSVDLDFFQVSIERPVGSTLDETRETARKVEALVKELPEISNIVTVVGNSASIGSIGGGSTNGTNRATITVNLTPIEERDIKSYEISGQLRDKLDAITEATVSLEELQAGPPTGAPIEVRLFGKDVAVLEQTAARIQEELEQIDGAQEIGTGVETGTGEFRFTLKRDRLALYGLSASQVANDLRTTVFGNNSLRIIRNGEETPITVRGDFRDPACVNDPNNRLLEARDNITLCDSIPTSITEIQNLLIPSPQGAVRVADIADVEIAPSVTVIRHDDRENIVSVTAHNREDVPVVTIIAALQERIAQMDLPNDVRVSFGGETEDVTESFQSLANSLIVGILLILFFLVLQFKSFKQPMIIMFALPLSLIGVFIGLALLSRNFSFPGFIGIVALSGVVVNDAIVLIDRVNQHIRAKLSQKDALIKAAGERLQPIILTSVTTGLGVLPLAFANELWGDLAWTVFFGIIFSTVLTLIIIPILYMMLEAPRKKKYRLRKLLRIPLPKNAA